MLLGKSKNIEEGEMYLAEFSEKIGKSISDLEVSDIINCRQEKVISKKQADKLIAELKNADRVWQTSIPGLKCADFLW